MTTGRAIELRPGLTYDAGADVLTIGGIRFSPQFIEQFVAGARDGAAVPNPVVVRIDGNEMILTAVYQCADCGSRTGWQVEGGTTPAASLLSGLAFHLEDQKRDAESWVLRHYDALDGGGRVYFEVRNGGWMTQRAFDLKEVAARRSAVGFAADVADAYAELRAKEESNERSR